MLFCIQDPPQGLRRSQRRRDQSKNRVFCGLHPHRQVRHDATGVSINQTTRANQGLLPIRRLKALRTYALPLAGTVDKAAVAGIKTRMQATWPLPAFKDKNIRHLQPFLRRYQPSRARLIRCDAGHGDALLPISPMDEAGTVKSFARRIPAEPVACAYLRIRALHNFFRRKRRLRGYPRRWTMGAAAAQSPQYKKAYEHNAQPDALPCA